jgi:predicted nucleotidyltransferase
MISKVSSKRLKPFCCDWMRCDSAAEYRRVAEEFAKALRIANESAAFDVVLVGSVARGSQTSKSDIDIVVISNEKLEIFIARLRKGDDFAAWCVRHGVPLIDSGVWSRMRSTPEASVWPDWGEKVAQGVKKLILSDQLLQIGDLEAASEEMLYAARHTARAILLKANVFPLSGPEMARQLSELRQQPISDLLSLLNSDGCTLSQLRRGRGLLKKRLLALDISKFAEVSMNFIKTREAKSVLGV